MEKFLILRWSLKIRHRKFRSYAKKCSTFQRLQCCYNGRLSKPEHITVLKVRRGPHGGLTGRLRLAFSTAQSGPLLIGATSHKGGGLFVSC